MSEKKKQVIHVKDLVIKADNVAIESSRPQRAPRPAQRRDPFFMRRPVEAETAEENTEVEDNEELHHEEEHRQEDHEDSQENERRGPFSWF
jgi:hypothetical protein